MSGIKTNAHKNTTAAESKHITWMVIFDSTRCRVYDYNKSQLMLIKEIEHSENKLRDIDITSDKPGRYETGTHAHGTFSQESDPREIQIEHFSREISNILEHGRNHHAYEKLIVIASPHMHGLLLNHINKHVKDLIAHNIEKNLMQLSEGDLLDYVNKLFEK